MRMSLLVLAGGLVLGAAAVEASTQESRKVLVAYGPGGPHHALRECAELFRKERGIDVAILKGPQRQLERKIREDGDLFFGGAEYMLEDFARRNPGVLDLRSVERLHPRRVGVLVRKGNPRNLQGVACLQRDDIALLVVGLENMGQFHASPGGGAGDFRRLVDTGQEGVAAWRSFPELDAWVTYKSWHVELREESDFIEIPGDAGLRHVPVALTSRTPHRQEALQFIAFLKSPEARRIFVEHGWE